VPLQDACETNAAARRVREVVESRRDEAMSVPPRPQQRRIAEGAALRTRTPVPRDAGRAISAPFTNIQRSQASFTAKTSNTKCRHQRRRSPAERSRQNASQVHQSAPTARQSHCRAQGQSPARGASHERWEPSVHCHELTIASIVHHTQRTPPKRRAPRTVKCAKRRNNAQTAAGECASSTVPSNRSRHSRDIDHPRKHTNIAVAAPLP